MKAKKAAKTTSSKGGGKSSFVLMIGDEGSILLHIQKKTIVKRLFAQSTEKEHVRMMDEVLNANPKAPVTLLVDMMDQSYVRQSLPPVSSFNVGKIIRRRLNKDFSADDIKGYIIFGREKKGRKDWNYLMASLANPPLLQRWLDFAVERPNPFRGLGLVPLECQPLVKAIETASLPKRDKGEKPTEWHILISHHKVGGFRQIVLKNGQLVFTRLAQLVGEPTPEVIAGNIEQEMLNTLEYLKRLGLQDMMALTATIIASSDIKSVFDPKTVRIGHCDFYTPHEVAELISMPEIAKSEDHFGDVVIAGFIARQRKLMLTLFTAYTLRIAKIVRYRLFARSAAAVIALGMLGWMGMSGNEWLEAKGVMEETEKTQNALVAEYSTEETKKKTLPEKINTYSDIANLFNYFYRPVYDSLHFAITLSPALSDLATVKSYHWSVPATVVKPTDEDKRQVSVEFESTLTTPQEPREAFVASAQKLVDNIKKAFPSYEVTNSDLPGILSDSKELKTVINDAQGGAVQSETLNTTMKFTIKGPVAGKLPVPGTTSASGGMAGMPSAAMPGAMPINPSPAN